MFFRYLRNILIGIVLIPVALVVVMEFVFYLLWILMLILTVVLVCFGVYRLGKLIGVDWTGIKTAWDGRGKKITPK